MANLLLTLQCISRRFGIDIAPYNAGAHPAARRQRLIEVSKIDTVIDVGANAGQFGRELRRNFGYRGRIVSFEPLSDAFRKLQAAARQDQGWRVFNVALGDKQTTLDINIASNSESSSLLEMLDAHLKAAPHSKYKGSERVSVETLDALFDDVCAGSRNIYLKIDTQGYEDQVLRGAARSLEHIDTVQMELSLTPLYSGQVLFRDLCDDMYRRGFALVGLENNFGSAETGRLLQVDGIFRRDRTC